MRVPYRLIQFRFDPNRDEARNVGVMVFGERRAALTMLGVHFDETDPTLFTRLIPEAAQSGSWVYADWTARWQAVSDAFNGDQATFESEIGRIEEISVGQWSATSRGEIDFPPDDLPQEWSSDEWRKHGFSSNPLPRVAAKLFDELVLCVESPPLRFLHAVEELLGHSEVKFDEGFKHDETISVRTGDTKTFLHFPFLIDGRRLFGVKTVCFQEQRWDAAVTAVNDALFTFDLAVKSGFLDREGCLVLSDRPSGLCADLAARLDVVARRLVIDDPDASSILHDFIRE